MPAKKKITKKKTTTKKAPTVKKTRKQKTKKTVVKKKASVKRKTKEEISIGLLKHEIDDILSNESPNETKKELETSVMKELAKILPADESINKKSTANHTNLIVKSIAKKAEHSPFVLDLTEMIEKKKKTKAKKESVRQLLKAHRAKKQKKQTLEAPKIEISKPKIEKEEVATIQREIKRPRNQKNKKTRNQEINNQFTKKPLFYHWNLPLNWHRSLATYAMVCLLIVLPIKVFGHYNELRKTQDQIVNYANEAYEDLKVAGQSIAENNTGEAINNFTSANHNFNSAINELENIDSSLKTILRLAPTKGANLNDAENILTAGENITKIGKTLTSTLDDFSDTNNLSLTDKISKLQDDLSVIIPEMDQINLSLNNLRPNAIPEDKLSQFEYAKNYVSLLTGDVKELNSFTKSMNEILGKDYKRRYLFVFQNNNELRATGGFIGSMALVDIDRGKIVNMEIPGGGTYDMQGSLIEKRISPYPLHVINSLWEMQDANWFPDFPTSAQKVKWFYEKSGGPTVDGVIAINASLIPEILKVTGDIHLANYGQTFTARNFTDQLQENIDANKTSSTPKAVLAELAPELIDRIFSTQGEDLLGLLKTLKTGLNEKEIQLYFNNPAVQEKISSYGWTGEILNTSKDYVAVINSNIGGGKTDKYIQQNISVSSTVANNGEIINTVTIERKHTGRESNAFSNKNNLNYLRLYTPLGSKLLFAQGFSDIPADLFEPTDENWKEDETLLAVRGDAWVDPQTNTYINNEFNKTVFGNWLELDPGETKTVTLRYQLPFKLDLNNSSGLLNFLSDSEASFHSLFIQKQSGTQNTSYSYEINLPEDVTPEWKIPKGAKIENNKITYQSTDKNDQLIAFTLE